MSVHRQLCIEGWAKAAVGHLHHPRIAIGGADTRFLGLLGPFCLSGCWLGAWRICTLIVDARLDARGVLLRPVSLLGLLGLYGCCLDAWRICALIVHACLDTFCLLLRLIGLLGLLGLYGCCLGTWRICTLIVHACLDTFCLLLRPVSLDCLWGVLVGLARQVLVYRLYRPQGPRDALLALCGSTLARRTHAARSDIRAVIEFLPERLNLDLGLLQQVLQGLAAPETGSARMGTHAHA
ncbi:hypothetical protein D8B25_21090, partial [Verminephrobacter aporrectodeae subsp. tuberculatae]|nr:hypothetical protein [Verminephrobacter aporrectodeae subsp. tuberculatae]